MESSSTSIGTAGEGGFGGRGGTAGGGDGGRTSSSLKSTGPIVWSSSRGIVEISSKSLPSAALSSSLSSWCRKE